MRKGLLYCNIISMYELYHSRIVDMMFDVVDHEEDISEEQYLSYLLICDQVYQLLTMSVYRVSDILEPPQSVRLGIDI